MSLDKAIEYGKEKRKKYYGAQAIDRTCRCGGTCPYCKGNRLYQYTKEILRTEEQIKYYKMLDK